jgi:hypothetical protein
MKQSDEYMWRKYKAAFLLINRCTAQEFHDAYIAFMEDKPDVAAYRKFARRYHITVHPDARLPVDLQVILSVNIAAIKVMADTYAELLEAIEDILQCLPNE